MAMMSQPAWQHFWQDKDLLHDKTRTRGNKLQERELWEEKKHCEKTKGEKKQKEEKLQRDTRRYAETSRASGYEREGRRRNTAEEIRKHRCFCSCSSFPLSVFHPPLSILIAPLCSCSMLSKARSIRMRRSSCCCPWSCRDDDACDNPFLLSCPAPPPALADEDVGDRCVCDLALFMTLCSWKTTSQLKNDGAGGQDEEDEEEKEDEEGSLKAGEKEKRNQNIRETEHRWMWVNQLTEKTWRKKSK